jgi:hypothetical protein
MPKIAFILLFLFFDLTCFSQTSGIHVFSDSRYEYKYPWAGGMNSCQYGKVDLDMDGIKDLVVFDRVGDRIMPYLVVSAGSGFDYKLAPEYAGKFPVLSQWAIFEDYNLDGKTDIFTYSPGYAGMKVYKNTSDNELEFRLEVFPYLESYQGGGEVNILVTYADYPAIADLDGDGDLDILTFYGLGAFVEKHRNMSMEKYGHADSLDFEKIESCWGFFAEGIESNAITLDTCLRCLEAGGHGGREAWRHGGREAWRQGGREAGRQGSGENTIYGTWNTEPGTWNMSSRHTGSTFRIIDLNADDLPDLLLGDVDFPNLIALYNGGNVDTARMTSYDWQYMAGNRPVNLFSMPAAFYDDFDFDGVKDLLISPFDPNPFLPENFHSNWLYHNNGASNAPQFSFQTGSFLQKEMLDFGAGAYPVLFDVDHDGLTDLLVGNYGYYDTSFYDQFLILHTRHTGQMAYLKNTGSVTVPAFTLTDRDFGGMSGLGLTGVVPALSDLDNDGDDDMLLGSEDGQVLYCQNTAGQGEPPVFVILDEIFENIDVGAYSTPQLFDLDKDNLPDLIIGEKGGNINYFRNTGNLQNPSFTLITDSLGKINVTDYNVSLDGYSVPYFYRDPSGKTHLLVGSELGNVFYYTGIDDNLDGEFLISDTLAELIGVPEFQTDFGYRSSPSIADLDQDGYPELITGNFSGGLNYFSKNAASTVNQIPNTRYTNTICHEFIIFPNPANKVINIRCDNFDYRETWEISLYNDLGLKLMQYSCPASDIQSIHLDSFPAGIYLLKINTGKMSYSYRLAIN